MSLNRRILIHAERSGLQKALLVYDPHCDVPRLVGIGKGGYVQIDLPFPPADDLSANRIVGFVRRKLRQLAVAALTIFAVVTGDPASAEARGCWVTDCRPSTHGRTYCNWQCTPGCEGQHLERLPDGDVRLHYRCKRSSPPPPTYYNPPPTSPEVWQFTAGNDSGGAQLAADVANMLYAFMLGLGVPSHLAIPLAQIGGPVAVIAMIAFPLWKAITEYQRQNSTETTSSVAVCAPPSYAPEPSSSVPVIVDPLTIAARLFDEAHARLSHLSEPERSERATAAVVEELRRRGWS